MGLALRKRSRFSGLLLGVSVCSMFILVFMMVAGLRAYGSVNETVYNPFRTITYLLASGRSCIMVPVPLMEFPVELSVPAVPAVFRRD